MLRKILESNLGPMTDTEFEEALDLATTDIVVNRIAFDKRTSLNEVVEITERCFISLSRGKVA
ncbi:hypothetical protein [Desulfosporosinus sp. OT]|uniref:hypothetical protein n=1 Tax=Desulfosporosinus sp. OT TaxID=913865 RepID=UPI0002239F85|nr:hypothetical protein [Desulfosporosinus sp. OT]EGW40684.1 hypothetical protein DOT_1307 [Desulfosporosinus sp. OT]